MNDLLLDSDMKDPHVPPWLWVAALAGSLAGVPLLFLMNELVIGVGIVVLVTLILSVDERFRLFVLVGLLPFSHAGIGLSEFGGFGPYDLFLAWFLLLFLWRVGPINLFHIHLPRPIRMGVLMLVAFLPSLGNAIMSVDTAKAFVQLLGSILTAAGVYDIIRRRNDPRLVRRLLAFFVAIATLVSIDGLLTTATSGSIISVAVGRAYFSFFQDVNYYAGYLLMAIALAVGLLLMTRLMVRKLVILGCMTILTIATIATVSRAAMAVFVILMIAYVAYFISQRGMQKWIAALLVAGVLGVVSLVVLTDVGKRMVDLLTVSRRIETVLVGRDASLEQRSKILNVSLQMIAAHPVIGVGFGSFEGTFERYKGSFLSTGFKRSAHNTYLRTVAETGLIGTAGMVLFLGSLLFFLYRKTRVTRPHPEFILFLSVAYSIATFLLMSVTLDQMFEPHFWVMMGVALAYGPILESSLSAHAETVNHG